jgi:hypothetical protein
MVQAVPAEAALMDHTRDDEWLQFDFWRLAFQTAPVCQATELSYMEEC